MTVYYEKNNLIIRSMKYNDAQELAEGFKNQGWGYRLEQLKNYYVQQQNSQRQVVVAEVNSKAIGYCTVLPCSHSGPFAQQEYLDKYSLPNNIPTVCDFNVLEEYQNKGAGKLILDAIESIASKSCDYVCLGVGLHPGYGSAQRMYVKRGYVPDGSGVWFNDKRAEQNAVIENNDDLILYMIKRLKK